MLEIDIKSHINTSASKLSPSCSQMYKIRLLMISCGSGLNLNFAHLEASGSIILQSLCHGDHTF